MWRALVTLLLFSCGPEADVSNRIWFVGDSITKLAVEPNGFRKAASDLNVARNWGLSFVGTLTDGSFPGNKHDGHPTDGVATLTTVVTDELAVGAVVPNARVIAIMLGTNDARDAAYNGPTMAAAYTTFLNLISTREPTSKIIISDVPFIDPAVDPTSAANAVDLRARMVAVMNEYDRTHPIPLRRWSAFSVLNASLMEADGFHPNSNGHLALTNAFMPHFTVAASVGAISLTRGFGAKQ